MKRIGLLLALCALCGCALTTVNEESVKQGMPEAKVFELPGSGYSHKPSGAIRSRMSNMPTGKVVGFFIRPTTPTASSYQIEIVSKEPVSLFKLSEATSWEPSVLKDFEAALNAR